MSGWAKGDLAVCVDGRPWFDGPWENVVDGPALNEIVMVTGFHTDSVGDFMLSLKEWPNKKGWIASAFKRIKPDTEGANEDDAAWLKDLLTKKVKA